MMNVTFKIPSKKLPQVRGIMILLGIEEIKNGPEPVEPEREPVDDGWNYDRDGSPLCDWKLERQLDLVNGVYQNTLRDSKLSLYYSLRDAVHTNGGLTWRQVHIAQRWISMSTHKWRQDNGPGLYR